MREWIEFISIKNGVCDFHHKTEIIKLVSVVMNIGEIMINIVGYLCKFILSKNKYF